MVRHARCWILATMLALPLAPAAAQGKPGTATAAGIVYNAPERGTFDRGLDISLRGMGEWPRVSAIAPDHVGRTISDQPALYWFISRRSPVRVEITVTDPASGKAVVKESIARAEPGFHRFSLAAHNLKLAVGHEYLWSVAVVWDDAQRTRDVISQGALMRIEPPADIAARLPALAGDERARSLAAKGIWYDAISALSEAIEARPADAALRALRASLLEQAGLKDAAAFDKRAR